MRIRPHDLSGNGFESGDYAVQIQDGVVGFTPLPDGGGTGPHTHPLAEIVLPEGVHLEANGVGGETEDGAGWSVAPDGMELLTSSGGYVGLYPGALTFYADVTDDTTATALVAPYGGRFVGYLPDEEGATLATREWVETVTTPSPGGLSGVGMPEGVVTAPVGTRYTDTAATNGAIEWIKATGTGATGWRVTYGDTGWRDITSTVDAARWDTVKSISSVILVARTATGVTWRIGARRTLAGGSRATAEEGIICPTPTGFGSGTNVGVAAAAATAAAATVSSPASPFLLTAQAQISNADVRILAASGSWTVGDRSMAVVTYPTNAPWPAVLPGIPA